MAGVGHVHDLRNDRHAPATSIHVYSPPLSTMTFYERGAFGLIAPTRVDRVAIAQRRARLTLVTSSRDKDGGDEYPSGDRLLLL